MFFTRNDVYHRVFSWCQSTSDIVMEFYRPLVLNISITYISDLKRIEFIDTLYNIIIGFCLIKNIPP